jgi:hypothetical protein
MAKSTRPPPTACISRQVLEHEAHEHVVEGGRGERQMKEIGFEKGDVRGIWQRGHGRASREKRRRFTIDAGKMRARASRKQMHCLRTHATAGFEHAACGRIARVVVKQLGQGFALIGKSRGLGGAIPVNVEIGGHDPTFMSTFISSKSFSCKRKGAQKLRPGTPMSAPSRCPSGVCLATPKPARETL